MNKFLKTLIDEGKIELVEISQNIVNSYIEKAENSIISSDNQSRTDTTSHRFAIDWRYARFARSVLSCSHFPLKV